jgi:hypothetical protein
MSSTTNPNNRPKQLASDQKLIDGLNKHASTIGTMLINGVGHKPADLVPVLQGRLDAARAVDAARPVWQNAVQVDRDERAKTKALVSGLRQALAIAFAGSIDTLADFGLTPRKPRVVSPEKKAAAAAKAKATRQARNTMGKVQKKDVKGAVTATLVVTPIGGSQPAAPAGAPAVTPSATPATHVP